MSYQQGGNADAVRELKTNSDRKGVSLMDGLPERLSTAEILRAALAALFGQTAVSVKMWRGLDNIEPCVPVGCFAIGCRESALMPR